MTDVLKYEELEGGAIVVLTLNRPERRNAINNALLTSINEAVQKTENDPKVRAVVLASSHEKVFCAGADLADMDAGRDEGASNNHDEIFSGFYFYQRTKPWIAAVGGAAVAGGCEMVLACDVIVATPRAMFIVPEPKVGLVAGAGALHRLARYIPRNIAMELMVTGNPLTSDRALQYGLINRCVESEELLSTAVEFAKSIAANAPLSVSATMDIVNRAYDLEERELRALTTAHFERLAESNDAREGGQSFLEKRKPVWTGS